MVGQTLCPGNSPVRFFSRRRGGRVAEGSGLLNRRTGSTRTVSSNLIPSAIFYNLSRSKAASWTPGGTAQSPVHAHSRGRDNPFVVIDAWDRLGQRSPHDSQRARPPLSWRAHLPAQHSFRRVIGMDATTAVNWDLRRIGKAFLRRPRGCRFLDKMPSLTSRADHDKVPGAVPNTHRICSLDSPMVLARR